MNISVADGKYTIIKEEGKPLQLLRHGEPWNVAVADNLIMAMAREIQESRDTIDKAFAIINEHIHTRHRSNQSGAVSM